MIDTAHAAQGQQSFRPADGAQGLGSAGSAALRAELQDLKLLILAMWRELSALESSVPSERAEEHIDLQDETRRFESDLIRCALIRTGGRQRRAARLLGMKAATFNAKIKRYRIDSDEILNQTAALRLRSK
jgi:transcriptional regulator with GAF, ATPase, and Fis domain